MATKITAENVLVVEKNVLDEVDMYGLDGKSAENALHYICGVRDMAAAMIHAIEELGR